MTKRMLIDAAHPEETRVVIVDGSRVDELDFESRHKRQLRGNVYLAKVTRVEPSLQAAFIDYGGNRHGFLAFSEIHPDYYQLPYEDKLALQQEEEEELKASEDDDDVEEDENLDPDADDATDENDAEVADEQVQVASRRRKQMRRRRYKMQEVIKRGQILLVQAVKEERGNKGAAMTTYLSLAGRYCVLMPNTPRGGGISRKIASGSDRKRLKSVMDELDVPQGMGVIVRTAGAKRTKAEISRDYGYLSRLWDEIRDTTLKSVAPALIHEEGNLVKRSIRDLYNKEIEEVLVQGEDAYKSAKAFIKMLMPSHAKFVKRYDDEIPLFLRYDVERQIENSLDATVQLKSGGYLVIHPTEALVSVDVNSGKSTKERNIERTALKTNMEAAEELARQMRLRDLAGLIVVDFIDMDERKNNSAVERKMKDVLSRDRARIQTSKISQFGLMEISRQRRRRSLLEGSTAVCKHCDGVGRKRTVESAALAAIRAVEEFAIRGKARKIRLKCPPDVALYLLNEKRDLLTKVDEDADVFTVVEHDDDLIRPAFVIEVAEKRSDGRKDPLLQIEKEIREETKRSDAERKKSAQSRAKDVSEDEDETDENESDAKSETRDEDEDSKPRRRRGRRGGRNRKRRTSEGESNDNADDDNDQDDSQRAKQDDDDGEKPRRRRRRRAPSQSEDRTSAQDTDDSSADNDDQDETTHDDAAEDKPSPRRRRSASRRKAPSKAGRQADAEKTEAELDGDVDETADVDAADDKPRSSRRRRAPSRSKSVDKADDAPKPARKRRASAKSSEPKPVEPESESEDAEAEKPKRRRKAAPKAAPKATAKADASEDAADVKPVRRRRAPAKSKAEDTSSTDDVTTEAPKRRRKAPAKAAPKADSEVMTDDADTPKPARRRKAPSKTGSARKAPTKKAPANKASAKEADATSAPAKKAAPKRMTVKAASAKSDPVEDKPKPTRRRAAPKASSKASSKTSAGPDAKADTGDTPATEAAKPRKRATRAKSAGSVKSGGSVKDVSFEEAVEAAPVRRRKAPARKAAPQVDSVADPIAETPLAPEPAIEQPSPEPEIGRRRKAPARRKRGLIDRLMGKE